MLPDADYAFRERLFRSLSVLQSLTVLRNLEDQVMDYLVSVTDLKVFGCFIDFLQTATQIYLEDLGQATAGHGIHHGLSELQCYPAISRTT